MKVTPLLVALAVSTLGACKDAPPEPAETRRVGKEALSASAAPSASASPSALPRDRPFVSAMNDFCVITQQVNDDPKIKKAARPSEIVKRLLATSPPPAFLEFLQSLGDLESGARYAALTKAAAERGAPSWSCPALAQ